MTGRLVVLLAVLVALAVAAAVAVLGAARERPAAVGAASAREIGVSSDGVHYAPRLSEPLFDPTVRWVPGDSREARFWVRHQADGAGDLSLDVLTPGRTGLLDSGWLTVSARVGAGDWRVLGDDGTERLLTAEDVAAARPLPVTVRVALAPGAGSSTEVRATDLDLRVALAGTDGPASGGDAPPGAGTAVRWPVPVLVLLLLLAGPLLLLAPGRGRPATGGTS